MICCQQMTNGHDTVNSNAGNTSTVLCSPATYLFHLEVVNLLVAFCSTQLYTAHATAYPGAHPFTEVLMKTPIKGCAASAQRCRHPAVPAIDMQLSADGLAAQTCSRPEHDGSA